MPAQFFGLLRAPAPILFRVMGAPMLPFVATPAIMAAPFVPAAFIPIERGDGLLFPAFAAYAAVALIMRIKGGRRAEPLIAEWLSIPKGAGAGECAGGLASRTGPSFKY